MFTKLEFEEKSKVKKSIIKGCASIVFSFIIAVLLSCPVHAETSYTYDFSFDNPVGATFWIDAWQVYLTVAPGTVVTVNINDTHSVLENTRFIWQNNDGLLINPDLDLGINSYTFPAIQEGGILEAQCPVWELFGPDKAPKEIGYVNFYISTYSPIVTPDKLREMATVGGEHKVVMEDYVWHIQVQSEDIEELELDFSVNMDSGTIDQDVVDTYFYGYDTMELSLAHNGDFPLSKAVLELDAGAERAGKFGALYYYVNSGFEYMSSALVSETGKLNLDFQHASDYIVVFSEAEGAVEFVEKQDENTDFPDSESTDSKLTDGELINGELADGGTIDNGLTDGKLADTGSADGKSEADELGDEQSALPNSEQDSLVDGFNPIVIPIVMCAILAAVIIIWLVVRNKKKV